MVVTDHPTSRVSAAFLRESISRPIMTGMYLWVDLLKWASQ